MDHKLRSTAINTTDFKNALDRFKSPQIVPDKRQPSYDTRYIEIPAAVAKRRPEAYLTRDELLVLVDWKLQHGVFRPTLKGLAKQNAEDVVVETTKQAFAEEDIVKAIKIASKLRGIGPATASLLLSVSRPAEVPFFSDQLYRWCMYEDGPGAGWDRKIKYTMSEYDELLGRVDGLRSRLDVDAVDMEKVAYVLAQITNLDTSPTEAAPARPTKRKAEAAPAATKDDVVKATKRSTRSHASKS